MSILPIWIAYGKNDAIYLDELIDMNMRVCAEYGFNSSKTYFNYLSNNWGKHTRITNVHQHTE